MNTKKINLTPDARHALNQWFRSNAPLWQAEGADADEVREDVEAHLLAEFSDKEDGIEVDDVYAVLQRMGLPAAEASMVEKRVRLEQEFPQTYVAKPGRISRFCRWITSNCFWVALWPLLIVVFEMVSDFCGGIFFTPIASWYHAVLIAACCAIGWYHHRKIYQSKGVASALHQVLRLAAMVVASYWCILMVPVIISGLFGYVIVVVGTMGLGLLAFPLFILGLLTAGAPMLLVAGLLRKNGKTFPQVFCRSVSWAGVSLGLLLLLLVEGPSYITRYGVATDSPSLIRKLGSKKVLLQMCYEGRLGRGSQMDSSGYLLSLVTGDFSTSSMWATVDPAVEKRRTMYYRVTGKAFNSVAAPRYWERRSRGGDFEFDDNLGGDGVFARVSHLDMSASRLDGHVDHASGLGYWEWTMEFSNTSVQAKEARMQILLPPEGVVSRLTLWVNGQPQEAAFSSKAKVAKAYKAVAVERRKDPVLVRWVAPDRVLVQCFPVPGKGKMKIRLGMTAPLDQKGRFYLPRLIEQNYGMGKNGSHLETSFWIQGDVELEMDGIKANGESGKWRERHGKLSAEYLASHHAHVRCHGKESIRRVWTEDPFAEKSKSVVVRGLVPSGNGKQKSAVAVMVIDGSSGTEQWREAIAEAIKSLEKAGHTIHVIMAADDQTLEGREHLDKTRFVGGQNNVDALAKGYSLAAEHQSEYLFWLYGSQPVDFGSAESILQQLDRGFHKPQLMTVDLAGAPNRVLEEMSESVRIYGQARPSGPDDLLASLEELLNKNKGVETWEVYPSGTIPEDATKVWDQLARWKVWRDIQGSSRGDDALQKASRYQLVTPISGAVVLETNEQFKEFGLEQVDANSVPSIPSVPEPSSALLSMLGLAVMLCIRKRSYSATI